MAVKTVNAQGYDAVMAANYANSANRANFAKNANAANGGMQGFGAMLDKAGEKTAGIANDAQASKLKSTARQEIRADKSGAGKERQDVKAAEESVNALKNEQAAAEKTPVGEDKAAEANASEAKTGEIKTAEAKPEEVKAENAKPEETKAAYAAGAAESEEESDNMAMARISDALMQIIGQIKELLGVSDEEIFVGLEKANLKLTDLLVPTNMSKLLTEVAGEGNVMSLVTNEELYSKLQELTKTAANVSSRLLEELGLTKEEFDAVLEEFKLENADALKNAVLNPQPKDAVSAPVAEAKADDIVPETEAKPIVEIKAAAGAKTEAEPKISAKTESKPAAESKPESKPEAKTTADAKPAAEAKTEAEQKTSAEAKTDAKPAAENETEAKTATETEVKTESKLETEVKAESKPAADTGAKTEIKADASTKPVNENEKAAVKEEAKAETETAKEDAAIPAQAKQPAKTAADNADAKSAVESSTAKKQAEATVQDQQNSIVDVGGQQTNVKKQSDLQNAPERGGTDSRKDKSDAGGQTNAQAFDGKLNPAQTMTAAVPEALQTAAEVLARYTSENTQSILRQLADMVRVARNENLTQMEMQLHPASLGTVNVSLATKGGAVTAHFTTQNEAVKAAVEAQAVQLVSNLEAQGVKVEAVEVTVAGHQLEKNLEENNRGDQSRQEREESQRIQGARRNSINLNAYADDEEMLEEMQGADDATRIAMELMAANGNSMDLMA